MVSCTEKQAVEGHCFLAKNDRMGLVHNITGRMMDIPIITETASCVTFAIFKVTEQNISLPEAHGGDISFMPSSIPYIAHLQFSFPKELVGGMRSSVYPDQSSIIRPLISIRYSRERLSPTPFTSNDGDSERWY